MANPKKTYFLTPSFDYPPPPKGPIRLGNLLADPSSPDRPLNAGQAHLAPPPESVITTTKTDWKSELSKSNTTSIGLYAKALDIIIGAGADVAVNWNRENKEQYGFDSLDTTFFNPVEISAYLNEALKAPGVVAHVQKSWMRRSPVYVITGLKVVRGGKIKSSTTRGHGGKLSVGLDGSALLAPVEVGPEVEGQTERGQNVEWGASDDFVFAYRVSRLKLRKGGEMKEAEYNKGALYELREDRDGKLSVEDATFEIQNVEDDEAVADEYDEEELVDVEDGDEGVVRVVLT
ncbi:hypothetical protein EJ04DRAFT_476989 [Polyplosphaeria fusca]|uniref:Uncharacterized protein n=1 Tax=Polyplosphaeria fusca TaxID=682080 RepID=A0A9P4QPR0_9PLEO|nr:hypothetical protein EJ04DRAFT_476989 [Polyplosphaeria fusca]